MSLLYEDLIQVRVHYWRQGKDAQVSTGLVIVYNYSYPIAFAFNTNAFFYSTISQVKDPIDAMYGWCQKCKEKYKEEFDGLQGLVI